MVRIIRIKDENGLTVKCTKYIANNAIGGPGTEGVMLPKYPIIIKMNPIK